MAKQEKGPRIFDLSLPVENCAYEPFPREILYTNHEEGTRRLGKLYGLAPRDFPQGLAPASEKLTLTPHTGTHVDAPWHFGPTCAGNRILLVAAGLLLLFRGEKTEVARVALLVLAWAYQKFLKETLSQPAPVKS